MCVEIKPDVERELNRVLPLEQKPRSIHPHRLTVDRQGEPLLHHEFLDQVLQRCRKEKMYTAIGLYEINLLRFHRMGATKWEQRGKKYEYSDHGDMPEERMLELQERYLNNDIACYIGEDTPF